MTKTEKLHRARRVRAYLGQFVLYQTPHMREHLLREWGRDPDEAAMDQLLTARRALDLLIRDLGGPAPVARRDNEE